MTRVWTGADVSERVWTGENVLVRVWTDLDALVSVWSRGESGLVQMYWLGCGLD